MTDRRRERPLLEPGRVLGRRFRAEALLGRGGMGEVWRCRDLEEERDVAVKVVRPEVTAEPWAARLLHGEVLAMARLAHPSIVPIYDLLEEAGLGSFLVMEYRAGARSLRDLVAAPPPWPVLAGLLDEILSALGYAHAKGVLHLDIKPENVLVQARGGALRATLLDFGIARVRQAGEGIERWSQGGEILGTLSYMAPEQLAGEVRRMGRWTDLFALGSMIYEAVAGAPPFRGDDAVALLLARLAAAPPLVPRPGYAVPGAFCALVTEMLAAEPHARPRFAADVRGALRSIVAAEGVRAGGGVGAGAAGAAGAGAGGPGSGGPAPESGDPIGWWLRRPETEAEAAPPAVPTGATSVGRGGAEALARARTLLALPSDVVGLAGPVTMRGLGVAPAGASAWTERETGSEGVPGATIDVGQDTGFGRRSGVPHAAYPRAASPLASGAVQALAAVADAEALARTEEAPPSAGSYGLYGLRDLPLLGRFDERRATWEVVRDAFAAGLPRVVLLEGIAGVGKSRLARDVIERGEQLGLLEGMQTWWSARGSADEGLRGLVENTLDCRGAAAERVEDQLSFWLAGLPGDHQWFARDVRVFLRPPPGVELDRGMPLRVALELVERAAARRPVLLWLDDLQWGRDEAVALAEKLLAHRPPLPVCVVGSVRSDEPPPPGWDGLVRHERVRRVAMAELDLEATRLFVRGLLDVDDRLCRFIAERAEGNPLFAAQLLHQLVEADALELEDGRYRLTGDFDLGQVPADIDALWARRVERAVPGGRERDALSTLALARDRLSRALVGALEDAAADDRGAFAAARRAALAAGLVREDEGTLVWVHGLLREHLMAALSPAARPVAHLRAAVALGALRAAGEDVDHERAVHLEGAGRLDEAMAALRSAIQYSRARGRTADSRVRSELLLEWSGRAGVAAAGRHRSFALANLAWLDHEQNRLEDAERRLEEALALAGPEERPRALAQRGVSLRKRGREEEALAAYAEMAEAALVIGDHGSVSRALHAQGQIARRRGRPADARVLFERALEAAAGAGDEGFAAKIRLAQAWASLDRTPGDETIATFERARAVLARLGDAAGEHAAETGLAGCYQARSLHAECVTHLERALVLAERLGLTYLAVLGRLNLADAEGVRGGYAAARAHAEAAERIEGGLRATDVRVFHAYVRVEIASALDGAEELRGALDRAIDGQRASGHADPVLAKMMERAAANARARGRAELGGALLREAQVLWTVLGRTEEAERVGVGAGAG